MDSVDLGVPQTHKFLVKKEALFDNPNTSYEIPVEVQKKLMNGNAQFLIDLAAILKQRYTISSLAINLCHYFFYKKCYINYDRFVVAASCMLLALKLKDIEGPKMRNICIGYHKIMAKVEKKERADALDEEQLQKIREKIILHENKLLKVLNFEFDLPLPYLYIDKIMEKYFKTDDKQRERKLSNLARIFALDSYRTYACLVYRVSAIAIACLVIAADILEFEMPPNMRNSGIEFNKLSKEEKIAAEDILMTNWIKEIDPEAGLQDVNNCLKLLKELFETYQNPTLNTEIDPKDEEVFNNSYEGLKPDDKML